MRGFRYLGDPGPCIVCCAPHCTCVSPDYVPPTHVTGRPRGLAIGAPLPRLWRAPVTDPPLTRPATRKLVRR